MEILDDLKQMVRDAIRSAHDSDAAHEGEMDIVLQMIEDDIISGITEAQRQYFA